MAASIAAMLPVPLIRYERAADAVAVGSLPAKTVPNALAEHRHSQEPPFELPRTIARLGAVGGMLVALLVPLTFLAYCYRTEVAQLETAVRASVPVISKQLRLASRDGLSQIRAQPDLADSAAWMGAETWVRVIDANRVPLVERNREPPSPLLTRYAAIDEDGSGNWQLEISRSMRPLLLATLLMFAPGLLLGWMTFVALKDVPMRAFRLAMQELADRKTAEERLAKSLAIFSATLESTADGIFVTDVLGHAIVANKRFLDLWSLPMSLCTGGNGSQTLLMIADQLRDPAAFMNTQKDLTKHVEVDHGAILELRDGRLFEWSSRPQYIDGAVVGRVSSFRDISQRKRAEVLLTAEKEVLELVVCGSPLKLALGVLARHVEVLSRHLFCAILFRESAKDGGLTCATGPSLPAPLFDRMLADNQLALEAIFVDAAMRKGSLGNGVSGEFNGVIEDISVKPAWVGYCKMVSPLGITPCVAVSAYSSAGDFLGLIVVHCRALSDQTPHDRELILVAAQLTSIAIERRQAENRLRHLAHFDALTQLPNRDLFRDRLSHALAQAERRKSKVAVMFLDLDRFKTVNDTLGHDAGDRLLIEVAARLRQCMREEDTVARLGGDEFTVILEQVDKAEDAALVATKIVTVMNPPFDLHGQEAFVTPSIGIAIYPADSPNAEALLKNADTAMYHAKEEGGNGYRFFTPAMNVLAANRLELESGLRRALEREEFVVHYQPKLELSSKTIVGAEALLRWKHPERGLISPAEFIPILEETGLIEQAGLWILRAVCAQMRAWQDAGMPALTVAVNLSGRQLQRDNKLSATIVSILEEFRVAPHLLELEVTESILMNDADFAAELLTQIRATGVIHIDIDDFGTGYSSLSYLKRFPIDALKLDKSFVDGLPHDQDDAVIARAVIALAHSLKLSVIAEGVETEEQLAFLHENDCDVIQGYLVSRPIPADEFAQLIRNRNPVADVCSA
jgi:diguanylate cyclase (GGDEF)-like protein/PAS domain S-box-containing protein